MKINDSITVCFLAGQPEVTAYYVLDFSNREIKFLSIADQDGEKPELSDKDFEWLEEQIWESKF